VKEHSISAYTAGGRRQESALGQSDPGPPRAPGSASSNEDTSSPPRPAETDKLADRGSPAFSSAEQPTDMSLPPVAVAAVGGSVEPRVGLEAPPAVTVEGPDVKILSAKERFLARKRQQEEAAALPATS
jgi:hypothetical protein